jgi:hypothetical protein
MSQDLFYKYFNPVIYILSQKIYSICHLYPSPIFSDN